jgi:hypothetical protein
MSTQNFDWGLKFLLVPPIGSRSFANTNERLTSELAYGTDSALTAGLILQTAASSHSKILPAWGGYWNVAVNTMKFRCR